MPNPKKEIEMIIKHIDFVIESGDQTEYEHFTTKKTNIEIMSKFTSAKTFLTCAKETYTELLKLIK